jgi:hypothetical protein
VSVRIVRAKWFCDDHLPAPETRMVACPRCCGFYLAEPEPIAGRDADGNVRLSSGRGELIATYETPWSEIRGWHDRATAQHWRRKYAAALKLLADEDEEASTKGLPHHA